MEFFRLFSHFCANLRDRRAERRCADDEQNVSMRKVLGWCMTFRSYTVSFLVLLFLPEGLFNPILGRRPVVWKKFLVSLHEDQSELTSFIGQHLVFQCNCGSDYGFLSGFAIHLFPDG